MQAGLGCKYFMLQSVFEEEKIDFFLILIFKK